MLAKIEVADREEAALIRAGLRDDQVRAVVKIIGALKSLPSDLARERVLRFAVDVFEESDAWRILP